MRLTKFFVDRPTLFWSLVAGILVAGVLSYFYMPKLEDPAVAVKQAMVVVPYPGASAHDVELEVAMLMEDELRALPDVKKITTECRDGMAMLTVEFKMTVLLEDLEQHFDLLRRKVNDVRQRLPQGCYAPIVMDDMMDVYGIFYALTSDGYSYPEMYKYAKYIRRELLSVEGVKRVNIAGNRDEVINIVLSRDKLSRNGVVPTQVMTSLQNAGKKVNAGAFHSGDERIPVRISGAMENEEDIRNLLISTPTGKQIRLGDIAEIERGFSEPQRNGFFVDGKPALAICIAMEADAIVPDVGKAVDARLAEAMKDVPAGLETEKIFFQPDKVTEAVDSFMVNLVESVAIVILVLIFTMGLRSGVIIGFGLILTIAVSFPILLVWGTTLQRISLGAFIVAMGMLVDNAIVIMDGILIDRKRGLPQSTYLYRIGKNTAMPLLGATVIAASTFMAVYLSPDSAGEYAHDLFLVLCVSLLASWVLALTQVPVCAKAWLPKTEKKDKKESGEVMPSEVQASQSATGLYASAPSVEKGVQHLQFKGRFILTSVKSGLMLIDQHRAHLCVLYERYMNQIRQKKGAAQGVLFPEIITLPASEAAVLESIMEDLSFIGFELTPLGGGSYAINGVPSGIDGLNPIEVVQNMVHTAMEKGSDVKEEVQSMLALTLARAAAIVYGQVLTNDEMASLVDNLFACPSPNYTPDGRTVLTTIKEEDIEKMFAK